MAEPLPLWLQAGRYQCARQWPYIASVLWSLEPHPVDGLFKKVNGTFGVDAKWRLYYDPQLDSYPEIVTSPQAIAWDLMHEVGHVLREHSKRFHDRNDMVVATTPDGRQQSIHVSQLATDYEINDDLDRVTVGHEKTSPSLHPSQMKLPEDQLAEWYYDEIVKQAKANGSVAVPNAGHDCGSCSGGGKRDHELDGPGNQSSVEKDLLRRMVAEEIRRSKNRDNVPSDLARWAEEFLTPVVRWQDQLRGIAARLAEAVRGKRDYTYARPSRKSLPGGLILPSLIQPIPKIAFVGDTSGSMDDEAMTRVSTELMGLLRSIGGARVLVMAVDAAVHTKQKVRSARAAKWEGRGGTDMRVGIAEAEKERVDLIVVATDGYTPWPDAATRAKLVVVLVGENAGRDVPEWAVVVEAR